jgi:hypothetical protein
MKDCLIVRGMDLRDNILSVFGVLYTLRICVEFGSGVKTLGGNNSGIVSASTVSCNVAISKCLLTLTHIISGSTVYYESQDVYHTIMRGMWRVIWKLQSRHRSLMTARKLHAKVALSWALANDSAQALHAGSTIADMIRSAQYPRRTFYEARLILPGSKDPVLPPFELGPRANVRFICLFDL